MLYKSLFYCLILFLCMLPRISTANPWRYSGWTQCVVPAGPSAGHVFNGASINSTQVSSFSQIPYLSNPNDIARISQIPSLSNGVPPDKNPWVWYNYLVSSSISSSNSIKILVSYNIWANTPGSKYSDCVVNLTAVDLAAVTLTGSVQQQAIQKAGNLANIMTVAGVVVPEDHTSTGSKVTEGSIVGEPVNIATGAYIYDLNLIRAQGSNLPFDFSMHYSSRVLSNRGKHWQHNYEWHVTENADMSLKVQKGDGSSDYFFPAGAVYYASYEKTYTSIVKTATGFTLTTKHGDDYIFDTLGDLVLHVDLNGNMQTMSYNNSNQLSTLVDSKGQTATFTYNSLGDPIAVDYAGAYQVSLAYDVAGNLSAITDVNGNKTSFSYDASGNLITIVDAEGVQTVQNSYNVSHQVKTQIDANGAKTSYAYQVNASTSAVTVTDRLRRTYTKTFDALNRPIISMDALGGISIYAYDSDGNMTQHVNPLGKSINQTFDARGNRLTSTDATGNTTTFTYDTNNNLLSIIKPTGAAARFTYDTKRNLTSKADFLGNITTFTYDSIGRRTSQVGPLGNTIHYTYATNGNLLTVVDAGGNTSSFTYDKMGRVLTKTLPSGATSSFSYDQQGHTLTKTNALGSVLRFTYNKYGKLIQSKDMNGNTTLFSYDRIRRLSSVTDPLGNVLRFSYDAEGNRIGATDALGNSSVFSFNSVNRLLMATDPLGNIASSTWDAANQLISRVDTLGHPITMTYDAAGRLLQTANALNSTYSSTYTANGVMASITDPLGRTKSFTTDANDTLIQSIDPMGRSASDAFNAKGLRNTLTDRNANTTNYSYDALGRLTSETDPLGNKSVRVFNADGLLASVTNARGQVITYQYDLAGRLTGFSTPSETVTHTLDANGNQLQSMSSLTGTITRTFDALNRLSSRTDSFGNSVSYIYDKAGNLSTLTYPDGKQVQYSYDANHRMISVTDWASRVTRYSYLGGTKLLLMASLPDGSMRTYTYDAAKHLTSITDKNAAGVTIYAVQYTIDAAGQRTVAAETLPLAPQFIPTVKQYTYDASNQLSTATGDAFSYDADGNLRTQTVNGVTTTLSFNALGQLQSRGADSYAYDADGLRIQSNLVNGTTRYVQSPSSSLSQLLMDQDRNGATKAWNVYGQGLLYRIDPAGNTQYFHYNALGSTVALTDGQGALTDSYAFGPFGKLLNRTGTNINPFTLHGQWGVIDDGNNFYYMRARYYDANLKRFISRDNVFAGNMRLPNTLNRHVFVKGNPISNIDPLGEITFTEGTLVAASAVGVVAAGFAIAVTAPISIPIGVVIVGGAVTAASDLAVQGFVNGANETSSSATEYVHTAAIGLAVGTTLAVVEAVGVAAGASAVLLTRLKQAQYLRDRLGNVSDFLDISGINIAKALSSKKQEYQYPQFTGPTEGERFMNRQRAMAKAMSRRGIGK